MNYRDYNDNELISYIKENNEEANNIIFEKYRPLIIGASQKMFNYCKNSGLELNDLIQEGMLGLNQAINSFDTTRDITFYTYAKTCIERKIVSLVVASRRLKHKILNESISLEVYNDSEEIVSLDKLLGDNSYNPENIIFDMEKNNELIDQIEKNLTSFEQQVFELKINNFNYNEIAEILDKDSKSIDNALQRIKTKIKNELNLKK
ncbi:MAG: sigma-70 family RNA polymerase sigma factor [Bacilli bacterium]|nr:sigma-70 family RNA polymerase sigma factor [Bacilli bacterium]MDD4808857.1 sigma-70 family RNA polymerase sigma factor [Bacilli bacterium]